jgi:hypothetical protein
VRRVLSDAGQEKVGFVGYHPLPSETRCKTPLK